MRVRPHAQLQNVNEILLTCGIKLRPKKKCGFPVSSYKNLGRVGRF
jgi:hypothetical protein